MEEYEHRRTIKRDDNTVEHHTASIDCFEMYVRWMEVSLSHLCMNFVGEN